MPAQVPGSCVPQGTWSLSRRGNLVPANGVEPGSGGRLGTRFVQGDRYLVLPGSPERGRVGDAVAEPGDAVAAAGEAATDAGTGVEAGLAVGVVFVDLVVAGP